MKTLAEMIAVMQAAERGELIEMRSGGSPTWALVFHPHWDWEHCDYRVQQREPLSE